MIRDLKYKPLLFTTTLRNPERIKSFLKVLKEYDGKILTSELVNKIAGDLIEQGLYRPVEISNNIKDKIKAGKPLTKKERSKILADNPQKHKEKDFPIGWASRFDTWFKFPKELGFVYYNFGEKVIFSDIGKRLVFENHPVFEQQAFLNAFVKQQRNNPFRRVLNENVPLILLLEVIKKLNADAKFNNSGISRLELPLLIYWKDNDAEKLYQRIVSLREVHGFQPTREVIIDVCSNEIMQGGDIKRADNSILSDYPDEFIRKMRLTGLISLRGGGRFIDINKNEAEKIAYVLKHYSKYDKYSDDREYFNYVSSIDDKLFSYLPKDASKEEKAEQLLKWVKLYERDAIREELLKLSQKKRTNDDILKFMTDPVRLEFLVALNIKSNFPDASVIPNYPIDDEGLPTSTAPGANDTGDIECYEDGKGILVEVTMLQGRSQTVAEIWPVDRHLEKFSDKFAGKLGGSMQKPICYFVAPSIYGDTLKQINYIDYQYKRVILPKTIKEFVEFATSNNKLYPS